MAYRVVITKPGGPKVLDIQEISIPEPGPEEVCIAVHFAGINFADTLMRLGFYQPRPPFLSHLDTKLVVLFIPLEVRSRDS